MPIAMAMMAMDVKSISIPTSIAAVLAVRCAAMRTAALHVRRVYAHPPVSQAGKAVTAIKTTGVRPAPQH